MPYKYVTINGTIVENLSIIPNKYHEIALIQKNNTILAHQLGMLCPPTIVAIGESIMYELNNNELNNN